MFDNILTEIVKMGVELGITDKFMAILLFLTIGLIVNYIYILAKDKYKKKNMTLSLLLISIIVTGLYYLYSTRDLIVVEFKSNKEVYDASDRKIAFTIESNKDAYYYLHTEKEGTGDMVPLGVEKENIIKADRAKEVGYFRIKHYMGDERVILTLTTKPYPKFEKKIDRTSYTKELEYLGGLSGYVEENTVPMQRAEREILLKVKKDESMQETEAGNAVKIVINTESSRYSLEEEINFDIETNRDGYVTVFEATPLLNITRKKSNTTVNHEMRSFSRAEMPMGKHVAIAIYTEENEYILATDFSVQSEETKGGVVYSLVFHNDKQYVYNIIEYSIES